MAWPVPLIHASWTGTVYGTAAFVNKFLSATHARYKAAMQFSGISVEAFAPLSIGANIQSYTQINHFRPENIPSGTGNWRLRYRGTYFTGPDDATAATELLNAPLGEVWVHADPSALAIGQTWNVDDHVMWSPTAGLGSSFLSKVNALLASWGVPAMGSAVTAAGGIPWTRKYGDSSSPSTAYGPMQIGDIFGEWLFNEWRAVLEILNAMTRALSWTTPTDTWYVWETVSDSISSTCAEAKSVAESTWANARTRAVSPVTEPPGRAGASGRVQYTGAGYLAYFKRTFVQYHITTLQAVDNGTYRLYLHILSDGDFDEFGDGHTNGKIRQIDEVTGGSAHTLSPTPMKDPSSAASDVNDISCPAGTDPETKSAGYYFQEVPGMVCAVAFPAP